MSRDLDPAEMLLAGIVKQAVRDARQTKDARLREDATHWLWVCTPDIARRADLPAPAQPEKRQELRPSLELERSEL